MLVVTKRTNEGIYTASAETGGGPVQIPGTSGSDGDTGHDCIANVFLFCRYYFRLSMYKLTLFTPSHCATDSPAFRFSATLL